MQRTRAAAMTLKLKVKRGWTEEAPDVQTIVTPDGRTIVLRKEEDDTMPIKGIASLRAEGSETAPASMMATLDMFAQTIDDAAADAATQPVVVSPDPTSGGGVVASAAPKPSKVSGLGIQFEIELWRADLLTTVLELDTNGNLLMGGLTNPLSPPGECFLD